MSSCDSHGRMCEFYPSRDTDGAVVRPLPRVKKYLSEPSILPHVVQILLTFDPRLVEKVVTLMNLVMQVMHVIETSHAHLAPPTSFFSMTG